MKKKEADYHETEYLSWPEQITPGEAKERACGYCGRERTLDDYDGCLEGAFAEHEVMNACCGHGGTLSGAYVQFWTGKGIYGNDAKRFIRLKLDAKTGKKYTNHENN